MQDPRDPRDPEAQMVKGNTRPSPSEEEDEKKNTKSRGWVIVLNNWTEEEYTNLINDLKIRNIEYIIGKEIAPTTGTPHLQGYIYKENKLSFNQVKALNNRLNIRAANGTKKQNLKYCGKDENYVTNIKGAEKVLDITLEKEYDKYMNERYKDIIWKPWQQEIIDIINQEPDERKLYWFWEREGNVGKSFLCKYLDWKNDAIIANGKQSDIFNQYITYLNNRKKYPTVAIVDIPRSHRDYVCYSTFEKIKDGLFYSGKYEGGVVRLLPHHLLIVANFRPELSKLSEDRWIIKEISESRPDPPM